MSQRDSVRVLTLVSCLSLPQFMDLRTRYTALVTLTTQHVKYISDALRRLEEEEVRLTLRTVHLRSVPAPASVSFLSLFLHVSLFFIFLCRKR